MNDYKSERKADFKSLHFNIGDSPILYGTFITAIVNFVIVAFGKLLYRMILGL